MRSWADAQNVTTSEGYIRSDLRGIDAGVRTRDLRGLRTDCVGFSADVDQLYASLPSPDRTLTDILNRAATSYWGPGAQVCYGLTSWSGSHYVTFQRDLRLGTIYFDRAATRLRRFGIG